MKKPLTQERLILFVYDEICDPAEREQIEQEIRKNNPWYQMYVELVDARDLIDPYPDHPLDKVIKNIMDFSRSIDLHETARH